MPNNDNEMTRTAKGDNSKPVVHVSSLISRFFSALFERPIGIGFWIGMVFGLLNALTFNLPMFASALSGALIGSGVCIVACPAMRSQIKKHRQRIRAHESALKMRSRATSAFTTLE